MTVSTDDKDAVDRAPLRWPRSPGRRRRQPDPRALYAYLLDLDDDLADEFDLRTRVTARQLATVKLLDSEVGDGDLAGWFEAARGGMGLLILDGLLAFETRVGDRTTTELLGAGDLLQPPSGRGDELLEGLAGWRVLWPSRLALLDAEFADRVRPWPQIGQALMRRAEPARDRGQRAAGDHLPSAPRGSPRSVALAPGRALGEGRAGRDPPDAAAHPPAARTARRGRAAVDLARARAPISRRARHR